MKYNNENKKIQTFSHLKRGLTNFKRLGLSSWLNKAYAVLVSNSNIFFLYLFTLLRKLLDWFDNYSTEILLFLCQHSFKFHNMF